MENSGIGLSIKIRYNESTMLKRLTLQNIAIVEALEVSFSSGLTVITGETGSGKSILMEAIAMAFGAKVSAKEILRTGASRGRIELVLDLSAMADPGPVQRLFEAHDLAWVPEETELLVSREFTASGSRSRLNGVAVTRDVLEALRPYFLDFHGQHELTGLFQKAIQRACLDGLGGRELQALKKEVARTYQRWNLARQKLMNFQENQKAFEARRDFLQFQLQELEEARLTTDHEDTEAQAELDRLTHGEKLKQASARAVVLLVEGEYEKAPPVSDLLGKVEKALSEAARCDAGVNPFLERATGVLEEVKTLAAELQDYHESLVVDPQQLHERVERLDQLEKLKRKYGPTLADVLQTYEALQQEWEAQEAGDQNLEALEQAVQSEETKLADLCGQLTAARQTVAASLKGLLEEQLHSLALPAARFDVGLTPCGYGPEGAEEVEFLFSANPGEPLRPLAKVASGGELSRFLLALKVLTAESGVVQTLLFDEIDTGMSGAAAKSVGEKLSNLASHLQVLVITHQPIVAAMGDHHLHVEKAIVPHASEGTDRVEVVVLVLDEKEKRLSALSRLASGIDTDDEAVENYVMRLFNEATACKSR